MATPASFNGQVFSIPAVGDRRWGQNVTNLLISIAGNALSKSGGNFTLTADVNFGANFGVSSKYIKSISSNIAQSGIIRLSNNEGIGFRNAANSADLILKANAADQLEYNGNVVGNASDITALTTRVTTAESDIDALQAADVTLQNNINGKEPTITTLPIAKGGTGQGTKTEAFDALAPTTTKGDIIVSNGTDNVRLPAGANGTVLSYDSAEATGLKAIAPLTNPMSAVGDLIVGGASGAATRLAPNTTTTKKFLRQTGDGTNGTTPAWDTLVGTDLPSATASARGGVQGGQVPGVPGGTTPATGFIGEVVTSTSAGNATLNNTTAQNLVQLSNLPTGLWAIYSSVDVVDSSSIEANGFHASLTQTSATLTPYPDYNSVRTGQVFTTSSARRAFSSPIMPLIINITSATNNFYVVGAFQAYTSGSAAARAQIKAVRIG